MPCSTGTVVFNYAEWVGLFPALSYVTQPQATLYFGLAGSYCNNTPCSPVRDASVGGQRDTFLNLITAHIAALMQPNSAASSPSGIVGRITNATQGSVSVAASMPDPKSPLEGWFMQTQYGAMYWAASSSYRTARYVPAPARFYGPLGVFGGRRGFGGF